MPTGSRGSSPNRRSRAGGARDARAAADELVASTETEVYTIELAGGVAGCVQRYEETAREYRHAGLDIFLGSDTRVTAWGSRRFAWQRRISSHRLVIDPRTDNARASRACERVGFRPVRSCDSTELGADGASHDGLLMDLRGDELVEDPPPDPR